MVSLDKILKEIVEKPPTLGQDYWAIPYDESLVSALDGVVPGVFIATLNDNSKWFLIPYTVDLEGDYPSLNDKLIDVLQYLNYISSKSGVSDLT